MLKQIIYLPISYRKHFEKLDEIFKPVFSRHILAPCSFSEVERDFIPLEHPEMIFKEEFQNFALTEFFNIEPKSTLKVFSK